MPTSEIKFTKELNDYDKQSGEQARGSGLDQNTVQLRSTEWSISTLEWESRSRASNTEEIISTELVRGVQAVSRTCCANPIKHFQSPEVQFDSKGSLEDTEALWYALKRWQATHEDSQDECDYDVWQAVLLNRGAHTEGQQVPDHTEP